MTISIDKSDMYGVLAQFQEQCKEAVKIAKDKSVNTDIDSVLIVGMGGSAIAGDVLKAYLANFRLKITVVREYLIPKLDSKTLVFAVSYSGNTEETISAYREAVKKKVPVISISTGGKLKELCDMNETEFIKIPSGYQPRDAIGFLFFPMLNVLMNSNLIPNKSAEITEAISKLAAKGFIENAKHLSENLYKKVPIIYTSKELKVVGYRWKCEFNENSKIHAFTNVYPEFNHNEINGYNNLNADYYVIQLMDDDEHPRTKKRMEIVSKLIKERGVSVTTLVLKGNRLYKLLSGMFMGSWVSYFLALKYETDPTRVEVIENLKKMMKE